MLENQNKENQILKTISIIFVYLSVFYLPLSELFTHALESYTHLTDNRIFWLVHFYEPLLLILLAANIINLILQKRFKFQLIDYFASAFILYTFLALAIHPTIWRQQIESLRFLILPFLYYFLLRFSEYSNLRRLMQVYLIFAGLLAALGVFEYFFLPAGWISDFLGIANFGFGQNAFSSTNQATSFLAGPNQLASYLVLPFIYSLHRFFSSKKPFWDEWHNLFLLIIALALVLTFSRSAILGALVATVIFLIMIYKNQQSKTHYLILLLVVIGGLVLTYALYNGAIISDLILHGASSAEHLSSTTNAVDSIKSTGAFDLIFGRGVGSAGPAAFKFGGLITENYYLQVLVEVGIIGLLAFLGFFYFALKTFWPSSKVLFLTIVALLINAFFLHIFSDNPAMAATVFIIFAAAVNVESKNNEVSSH